MDARSLRVLEYPEIIRRLADQAATSLGRGRCQQLTPTSNEEQIRQQLAETSEARWLLEASPPSFGGITDVRSLLARAGVGSLLEPSELLAIRDLAEACRRLVNYFERAQQEALHIAELALRLGDYSDLSEQITSCIGDDAEIAPDASKRLAELYARSRRLYQQIQKQMDGLIDRYRGRGVLQDPVVVQRAGRWCLPVQIQEQSRVSGIVHDRSTSGATVFMEPTEVIHLGNELRETELAIEEEKRRILQELTGQVAARQTQLSQDLQRLTVLDFIFAKGRLSIAQEGIEPEIPPHKGYVNLHEARHPLLEGEVVPVDLWLGEDFATLVITGPNTGGKTVSLKTLGLLTLMAQSGLHVPAEPGTKIPIFTAVYADIGDEQSLQQSLSSFSSHMTQIIKIVQRVLAARQAGQVINVLVLLDEIGAGTDPSEGAALAMSLLEWFHEAGCRTVATTHYNELKAFAYAREGMENASVEFDVQTLAPTYHLQIGSPGSSNAFEIAQRLGLPADMAGRGRDLLEGESRDFVQALEHVQHTQRKLHAEQRQAQQTRQELEGLRDKYERSATEFQRQREQAVRESFEDARQIVAKARSRADQIINQLQQQDRHTAESEELRQELKEIEAEVEEAQQEFERQQQAADQPVPRELPLVESISRGDRVYVPAFSREGAVREVLDDETALVQIGQISIELNISDLRQPPEQPEQTAPESKIQLVQTRKKVSVPHELELRGMIAEEALAELDKYLDDASLAGLQQVRLIHGKGTGALREAVHSFLDQHRAVREFHLADHTAGGEGATEVELIID